MSLTGFLAQREIRARFRAEFAKPRMAIKKPLVAPPLSRRYALVGTAFDYLLRFYLHRRTPNAVHRRWVAEEGLQRLGWESTVVDIDSDDIPSVVEDESYRAGAAVLTRARAAHARYIASGTITDSLLRAVVGLAKLDVVYRSGFIDDDLGGAHTEDIRDLRRLIALVNPRTFRAERRCILNPVFGKASRLVGGADADFVIDRTLIDVKTTKTLELRREDFNQLIGYYILHELSGLEGTKRKGKISKIAIYFARYAHLESFDMKTIINPSTFPQFVRWFVRAARTRRGSASLQTRRAHSARKRERRT